MGCSFYTRCRHLTDERLYALYRHEIWYGSNERKPLCRTERLDALQELANRAALKLNTEPCRVIAKPINGPRYGYYNAAENAIIVNEHLINNDELVINTKRGKRHCKEVFDANAQLMDTVFHETFHAYQIDVLMHPDKHPDECRALQWKTNMLKGNYYSLEEDFLRYRIQHVEKSAFDHAERQTAEVFENQFAKDVGYQAYTEDIQKNSFENVLEKAKQKYGKDVETAMYKFKLRFPDQPMTRESMYFNRYRTSASETSLSFDSLSIGLQQPEEDGNSFS